MTNQLLLIMERLKTLKISRQGKRYESWKIIFFFFFGVNFSKLVHRSNCVFMVQLVVVQAEIDRMNVENQRLRGMLNQVSNNYYALQMHLVALMQRQQNQRAVKNKEVI